MVILEGTILQRLNPRDTNMYLNELLGIWTNADFCQMHHLKQIWVESKSNKEIFWRNIFENFVCKITPIFSPWYLKKNASAFLKLLNKESSGGNNLY